MNTNQPHTVPQSPTVLRSLLHKISIVLEMIKFRHSLFALPFALVAMLVAADGIPETRVVFWIMLACVSARSMAMTYNRFADRHIDARNPRTRNRALPAGLLSPRFAIGFIVLALAVFLLSAAMLNRMCLYLSPIAIGVLLGYSHCKRHTRLTHYVLGLALAIAPLGAWIAVRGTLSDLPLFLAMGVLFWTAGFDIIYASLDIDFDRRDGIYSLPARVGLSRALKLAEIGHSLCVVCFALFLWQYGLGTWAWVALALSTLLLLLEHIIVRPNDLTYVSPAFFTANALISILFLAGCAIEVLGK